MATSNRFSISSKPLSAKELASQAGAFDFNPDIALKFWMRTADTLLREADIYERERNQQQAYLLLMRYATLVAEKLPTHPAARSQEYKSSLKSMQRTLPGVVERLESLKPDIERRYNNWMSNVERQRSSAAAHDSFNHGRRLSVDFSTSDPAIAGSQNTLTAADHTDLAVKLAHDEIRRRDAARRATRQAGITEEEEQERRTAGVWDDWESAYSHGQRSIEDDSLQKRMIDTRRRMDGAQDGYPEQIRRKPVPPNDRQRPLSSATSSYRYPSISKPQPLQYDAPQHITQSRESQFIPPKPPKERYESIMPEMYGDPPIPELPSKTLPDTPPSTASLDDAAKGSFTFRPSAYLENGTPLRTLFLPTNLREAFLKYALPNTHRNLETCGILCGTLISNALFISRLVIPEQESTSDTCETVNEGALFEYCDSEDLMVLGWIHTHPTQTCFMSSRDLHTHCGYQVMMPESIAIVCAPSKDPSWGIFRLTDPPGMQSVLQCRQTGVFHPHPEPNIYTDALRPGHVFEAKGLQFEVVDLRP